MHVGFLRDFPTLFTNTRVHDMVSMRAYVDVDYLWLKHFITELIRVSTVFKNAMFVRNMRYDSAMIAISIDKCFHSERISTFYYWLPDINVLFFLSCTFEMISCEFNEHLLHSQFDWEKGAYYTSELHISTDSFPWESCAYYTW